MTLGRCYKPTVNEPETITDAKPLCSVRDCSGTGVISGHPVRGSWPRPHIERS